MNMVPVANATCQVPVKMLEAARQRMIFGLPKSKVPLAHHRGLIAQALQVFRQQLFTQWQARCDVL